MPHYHLRYNVYEHAGAAVENERWITLDCPLDDTQLKKHLEEEHKGPVSIIVSKIICAEEFELRKDRC